MKKTVILAALFTLALPAAVFSQKKPLVIKLASLAPELTPWGEALNNLAKEWFQATNGEVELRIYHNGVAGGESDVLRKLKQNQVQAAIFTSLGMSQVSPPIMTLSAPFFIQNDDELSMVLDAMRADLEAGIESAGFKTIAWSKLGWVHFFSRNPVYVPDDLKKQKLASDTNLATFNDAFREMGYQLVTTGLNDVVVFLNSRTIDAVFQSPINIAVTQAFAVAKNMMNLKVAPFMGGIVMNDVTWRKVPEKYRAKLLELAARTVARNESAVVRLEESAVTQMKAHGLVVNDVSAAQKAQWQADVAKAMPSLLGKTFDRDMYRKIEALLKAKRGG